MQADIFGEQRRIHEEQNVISRKTYIISASNNRQLNLQFHAMRLLIHHFALCQCLITLAQAILFLSFHQPSLISRLIISLLARVARPRRSPLAPRVTVMLLPERCKSLLLLRAVNVCADEEADDVEERNPGVFGQELLRKGEGERRGEPRDFHDGHEAGADGGADLVEGAGTGDDGH